MSAFTDGIARFALTVESKSVAVFGRVVELTGESIVSGSSITGAPGQPVDTGNLRASWNTVRESPTSAIIGTNVVYAKPIESGIGPHGAMTVRSEVGGFHSVALTIAGFPRIITQAVADVGAGA